MLVIGLNMTDIFQPVLLLSFLRQTAAPVHRSDTSMHPGGSFLLKQLNRPHRSCLYSFYCIRKQKFLSCHCNLQNRILNIPDIHLTVSLLNSYQGYHSRFPDLCLFCNRIVAASDKKKHEVYIINVTEHAS